MLDSEIETKLGQYFFKWSETMDQKKYILHDRELLEDYLDDTPNCAWIISLDHCRNKLPIEIDKDNVEINGFNIPFKVNTDFFQGMMRWEDGTEIGFG